MGSLIKFLREECAAVTVDWIVLCAAVMVLTWPVTSHLLGVLPDMATYVGTVMSETMIELPGE